MHLLHRTFGAAILRAPDDAAASGATTIDGATAAILALSQAPQEAEPEQPEAAEPESAPEAAPEPEATPSEAEPTAEDLDAAEAPSEEAPAEQPEPELPAIEAPHFWAAEDKAEFKNLPRQLQEKVLAYERNRDTATSKAIQQAREAESQAQAAKDAAEKEASALTEYRERVDKLIPDAEADFKRTWGDNPDWVAIQQVCLQQAQGDYQAASLLYQNTRAQYDAAVQHLQGLRAAKQEAETREAKAKSDATEAEKARKSAWVTEQAERMKTVAPELVDPKRGPELVKAVAAFLVERGVPAANLADAGADEWSLALDAYRYRQSLAQAKTPPPPKPKPAATPVVKPTAGTAAVPQATRVAQESKNRFAQKPTVDNAIAAILARSGQKG